MRKRALAAGLLAATVLGVPAASAETGSALPEPGGRYPVGVTELHLVDHTRADPWVPGAVRELMVTVRYPALPSGNPQAPYMAPGVAAAAAEADGRLIGVDPARFDYRFATHSRRDAAAFGHRPVVLYSPGVKQSRALGTAQAEHLASRGYVVVAVDHTHEAVAVEFPDGRVAGHAMPPQSVEVSKLMMATRVRDTRFVLDQLEVLAQGGNPDAGHRRLPPGLGRALDLDRVGMFGHSGGGFTAGETMVSDQRIDAGVNLDGSMAYHQGNRDFGRVANEGLDRPFLLMSAGDHSTASDLSWQEFQRHHRAWLRQLHLPAGEHFSYTDQQLLAPKLGVDTTPFLGTVDPARSMASQRAYLTAFFDEHLRHRPQPLLDGPSPDHPDFEFRG
ncbi:alpha/beta hydrolase family protein [Amycolatopsis albispora]|uniref:Lipase n=1 Tax=Amycolatopsis albispora TaxID=1804986 RepID=A0A344LEQ8_9PSEU|nr:lipase [Amycolatopsis albispora]AXB46532.1 lipase [Amycolatopsis albispora]